MMPTPVGFPAQILVVKEVIMKRKRLCSFDIKIKILEVFVI